MDSFTVATSACICQGDEWNIASRAVSYARSQVFFDTARMISHSTMGANFTQHLDLAWGDVQCGAVADGALVGGCLDKALIPKGQRHAKRTLKVCS
eukprot:scaffold3096_cov403-Prasinococcus_capsulatus_cf.AAC.20